MHPAQRNVGFPMDSNDVYTETVPAAQGKLVPGECFGLVAVLSCGSLLFGAIASCNPIVKKSTLIPLLLLRFQLGCAYSKRPHDNWPPAPSAPFWAAQFLSGLVGHFGARRRGLGLFWLPLGRGRVWRQAVPGHDLRIQPSPRLPRLVALGCRFPKWLASHPSLLLFPGFWARLRGSGCRADTLAATSGFGNRLPPFMI